MAMINFLLVDDEKPFIETLAERLLQRGFSVVCSFSGREALNQLERNKTIREAKIFDIRIKLYITKQERDEMISKVFES